LTALTPVWPKPAIGPEIVEMLAIVIESSVTPISSTGSGAQAASPPLAATGAPPPLAAGSVAPSAWAPPAPGAAAVAPEPPVAPAAPVPAAGRAPAVAAGPPTPGVTAWAVASWSSSRRAPHPALTSAVATSTVATRRLRIPPGPPE
jgi:hypothetical protein